MKKLDGSTMYEYLESYDEAVQRTKAGAVKEGDWAHYQQQSLKTALAVKCDHPVIYPTLGLANEAGEVAGKIKKIFRNKEGEVTDEDRSSLKYELGDVLWYLSQVCTALDIDLADVASSNLKKLFSRKARGELQGDGDKR